MILVESRLRSNTILSALGMMESFIQAPARVQYGATIMTLMTTSTSPRFLASSWRKSRAACFSAVVCEQTASRHPFECAFHENEDDCCRSAGWKKSSCSPFCWTACSLAAGGALDDGKQTS